MGAEQIRRAVEAARAKLHLHPEDAQSTDTSATAQLVDGLLVRVSGPRGASITTGMGASVGGTGTAPSPGWYLRAAEASCVTTLIAMRAAMLGVALDTLEVTVDSISDDRGMLGSDDQVPPGPLSSRISVRVLAEGVAPATLGEISQWGFAHSPVFDALTRPVSVSTQVASV